jgi:hypothetical protein
LGVARAIVDCCVRDVEPFVIAVGRKIIAVRIEADVHGVTYDNVWWAIAGL